jgi:AcrR family transcriptional regulator
MQKSILLGRVVEAGSSVRQERRDALANRALILETAKTLFAERGVAEVTMADIALAAGVGKGTLYRRFANKGKLCLALMDSQLLAFQEDTLATMRRLTVERRPILDQLDGFLEALVYFTDAHIPLLCEVQRSGLLEGIEGIQRPHFWLHMTVSGMLQAAIFARELMDGLDVPYLADAILATLRADLIQFQREARGFSRERILDGLRSLLDGLTRGAS